MKKMRAEELLELRDAIAGLQEFVGYFSNMDYPHFYKFLDYMKNNIEIYICLGEKDFGTLEMLLIRDWYQANNSWTGLTSFQVAQEVSEESIEIYYNYALLVKNVADYFAE